MERKPIKKSTVCFGIFVVFLFIIEYLEYCNIKPPQTWFGNAAGTFLSFLPLELGLYFITKEKPNTTASTVCRILFWFILICFIFGSIATFLETQGIIA